MPYSNFMNLYYPLDEPKSQYKLRNMAQVTFDPLLEID